MCTSPIAVYWSLYLTARNYPHIALRNSAEFYLHAATQSIYAANCAAPDGSAPSCIVSVGLMDGTVFREVLRALISEGKEFAADAAAVESLMRQRTFGGAGFSGWNSMDNPVRFSFES